MLAEHAELERELADPAMHADQDRARALGKRYAELTPVVETSPRAAGAGRRPRDRPRAGRRGRVVPRRGARAGGPPGRARGPAARAAGAARPDDDKDVILEIKAGEGGEESALFAGDLLRMYLRYAERLGWRTEVLDATESDLGGYKDVQLAVKSRGTPAPGEGVWSRLKFEGGVHRVQRVPVTESQGRIHTSAAGVLVLPEAEEVDVRSTPTTCASTSTARAAPAGRASTPPTPPCASRTCRPASWSRARTRRASCRTGSRRCASCGPGCWPPRRRPPTRRRRDARRSQVRTVDRSERIRTYNFAENRIADHRVGFKAYNLDQVLDGDLDAVVQALVDADAEAKLAAADVSRPLAAARRRGDATGWPRPASRRPGTTPRCWPRHSLGIERARAVAARRPGAELRGVRRPAGRPRAAAAHHRCRPGSATSPCGRTGRLRAATRDRGRGRRRAGSAARRRAAASSSTSAPGPARSRSRWRTRCPGARCTPSSWTRRRTRGPPATARARRSTSAGRHGDGLPGARRHRRRGGQQPAVHPGRAP